MKQQQEARRDKGMTLVEMLIVVAILGLIATTIAGVIVVVLRTAPTTQDRTDDARSLQGLVTWIPQDVDAAPPHGFNTDPTEWPCGGPAPAGHNLISMEWNEQPSSTFLYAATYRYEQIDSEWHVVRYACEDGASGTMSAPSRLNLTSELAPWNAGSPPAYVELCDEPADEITGACPAGHVIGGFSSPDVESIKIYVTRLDGVVSTIDAAPKNPNQDLSSDPNAVPNSKPTVDHMSHSLSMQAGTTVVVDLVADTAWNPTDPDGDPISVAVDSSYPIPAGITAIPSDPLKLTITADAGLPAGPITTPLTLVISDNRAGWVDPTLSITILPEPNEAPQLGTDPYDLELSAGQTVLLSIDSTHGAWDPNGDPLELTQVVSSPPSMVLQQPQIGGGLGPMEVRIKAPAVVVNGPTAIPIVLRVSDDEGAFVDATINITYAPAGPTNNAPVLDNLVTVPVTIDPATSVTLDVTDLAGHGARDPDGHPMSISIGTLPTGITATLNTSVKTEVTFTASPTIASGTLSPSASIVIKDVFGATVNAFVTFDVPVTPPPGSDCVLQTLNANPASPDRQGNGNGARHLKSDVLVTLTYSGTCDGLVLNYDSGDTSGLGVGSGRVFPPGSPSTVAIYSSGNGGTEKWTQGIHTLTVTTTSPITANSITFPLDVQ